MKIAKKILIVENDPAYLEPAKRLLTNRGYHTQTATNAKAAIKLLEEECFHIALVDLNLEGWPPNNSFGFDVLNKINGNYPDCYRLLYTNRSQDNPIEVIKSLSVPNRKAQGCFLKDVEPLESIPEYVDSIWKKYIKINEKLNIEAKQFNLMETLNKRFYKGKGTTNEQNILLDSFLSIIGRLFYGDNEIEELVIEPFKEGFSKTILLNAVTKSSLLRNRPGKPVIIKFGNKDEIQKESVHFEKYVQWYLTQNQTIQKLSFKSFNNYAALLFTFAGDSPQNIFTFTDYIKENPEITNKYSGVNCDAVTQQCINNMFNPDIQKREWYHPDVIEKTDAHFIGDYYFSNVLRTSRFELNKEFFEKQILTSERCLIKLEENNKTILFTDIVVRGLNPLYFCQNTPFALEYSTCIVHGDLNGSNIIVGKDGNMYLIDYAHTGRGHVFQDFIDLELSVRDAILWKNNCQFSFQELYDFERSILDSFDEIASHEIEDTKKNEFMNKAKKLICMIRQYAISNFPDEHRELYNVGLFCMSLRWITYHIKLEQKRHLILLATLLAEGLEKTLKK